MNCDQFLEWMKTHTGPGVPENPEIMTHLNACPACRQIFSLNTCLEAVIQQAFIPHRLPAGLVEAIDACVDHYSGAHKKKVPAGHDPTSLPETVTPGLRKTPL